MMIQYSKEVMKNFLHPKNYGIIKNPDGFGEAKNPECMDVMYVYIRVGKNEEGKEIIKKIKFTTYGCAAAISSASITTQLAEGKTLEEAKKITPKTIVGDLNGLPVIKVHCSKLACEALKTAIKDYKENKEKNKNPTIIDNSEACEECKAEDKLFIPEK